MKSTSLKALTLVGALLVVSGVYAQDGERNASTGGVCVPPDVISSLNHCPEGAPQRGSAPRTSAPQSQLRTATREQEETNQEPQGPGFELSPEDRQNREAVQARSFDLLEREVNILKRMARNTRASNPQRPDILLRLAETQFEMQTALTARVRGYDQPIYEHCTANVNENQCRQARQGQTREQERLDTTRQEAIRTYIQLVQDHPDFERMDEVLFSLAFGLEELRQHDRARQVYHRLIKGHPESRFIPHAYLSFAEFYFNEQEMSAALQFYEKVREFPPERNPVYGYAIYKSAWAYYNNEDYRGALQAFVETIEFATQNPDATDATNLARQARRELVMPYAMVGNPGQALDFFRRFATDEEQARGMLERLAELYYDTGQWQETIGVYQNLIAEDPEGDKLCYWQSRIANAVISSSPKRNQVEEIQRMVNIYERFAEQGTHSAESVTQCKTETAGILAWLATAWHREAIGTADSPGTGDEETMDLASTLYNELLTKFPDMDELEFENIAREDWPTEYRVQYYYSELLWKRERWEECGPAFDRVVELDPQGEYTGDAAYASVLCYNNLYQQNFASRERQTREEQAESRNNRRRRGRRRQAEPEEPSFEPREFTELEGGMIGAFERFLCYVQDSEQLPTIKYRLARIYYEANRFQEASVYFRDIAWNHRDSELAEYAANLYLDSLATMGERVEPKRPACITEVTESIDPLREFYCSTPEDADLHPDLCGQLTILYCNSLRLGAQALGEADQHYRAGLAYVDIYRNNQECAEVDGFAMDEVLFNAAIHFEAGRLLGRAIRVRKVLIDRFPESEYARRAVYLIGANYHALAFYDQAADYYERYARNYPQAECSEEAQEAGTCGTPADALQNAVFFRMGLNDTEAAEGDAELFARNYGRRQRRESSQVSFGIGSIYERAEDWPRVNRHYTRWLRDFRRHGMPHQIIRANVLIGRAYWETDNKDRARRYFETAKAAWESAPAAINELELDNAEKIRYLKEALDSVAEAYFYLAEYKYDEFRRVAFPRYRGGRSMDRVNRWAQGEFVEWIQAKTEALAAAEAEYAKVADLRINLTAEVVYQSAPWQIAAAARSGQMYQSFVNAFRSAPVPEEIENDPELFDIYVDALDGQSQPLQAQAIQRFEFCLVTATNVRWFNEWSRVCEQELNVLNPREYPLAAELRGEPNNIRGSAGQPGAVALPEEEEEASASSSSESANANNAAGSEQ